MRSDKLLIISGSRDWTDEGPIKSLLLQFDPYWTLVIHGDCRGADRIAGRLAESLGFTVVSYPADWNRDDSGRYDASAGHARNEEMQRAGIRHQRYGVAVHAGLFPLPQSRGTVGMYRLCQLAGFDIHIPDACKSYM